MAFSGGTFSRLYNWVNDRDGGIKILASRMDAEMDGMATGLSTCILKDGSQTVTANIPMATYKFTGLGAGTGAGESVRYEQVVLLSAGANQTITRSAAGTVLTLESTEAGATSGPDLSLHRNSASPADSDVLASILFDGEDDGGAQTTYARIQATALDVTDSTEDANLRLAVMVAGTLTDIVTLGSSGMSLSTDLAIAHGGTGASTAQAAADAIVGASVTTDGFTHVTIRNSGVSGIASNLATILTLLNALGTTKGNILYHTGTQWNVLAPP